MIEINKGYQEPILGGINLQLFAEGGEGEGAGTKQEGSKEEGEEDKGTNKDDKTFTQEDVNNIASKEAKKTQEKLFKELGIEDFDNAKEGMKKFQEWQESQKTEAELKDEKLTNLEKDHLNVQTENQILKAQISAVKAGVNSDSVEDVVVLANNLVSDEVDMDAAIAKVVEKYPHFATAVKKEGEEDKEGFPYFSHGEHSKKSDEGVDVFQAKLNKYK